MKCKDCNGEMDIKNPFFLNVSCRARKTAYACKICSRLFWEDGNPVFSRGGEKVFLKNGHIVSRDDKGRDTVVFWHQ